MAAMEHLSALVQAADVSCLEKETQQLESVLELVGPFAVRTWR